jgi:hypothetical protein
MTDLKGIKGFRVRTLDTDSIVNTPPTGAWASGGDLNDNKPYGFGCGGVQTAAIAFGGGLANDTTNENYNGTSWTENSAMNNGYSYATGTGSQTDAIAINGLTTPPFSVKNTTEEWNGSSWTAGGNTNTARYNVANQTLGPGSAASFIGGRAPDYQPKSFHEQYNGTSWTETTDTPTDIFDGASSGVQTNAILASGNHSKQPPGTSTQDGKTVTWDGSSWTEITEYSTARTNGVGTGVYNDFLYIGGYTGTAHVALTEKWNGSSWTEIADMGTGKNSIGGGKTESDSTSSIVFGGSPTPSGAPTQTEEFNIAPPTATIQNVGQVYFNSTSNSFRITEQSGADGSFSSGGNMNSPGSNSGGASNGSTTATLVFAGDRPSRSTVTEQYNGSAWTEVNDMNTGRNNLGGAGTYTSALGFGGGESTTSNVSINESWDGTSWTEVNDLNTVRIYVNGCGLQTAALAVGNAPNSGITEDFDGTSFTERADLNTGRFVGMLSGTPTAAIFSGGSTPGNASHADVEQFNGTAWTEINNLNTGRQGGGRFGNKGEQIVAGGYNGTANIGVTEFFNGTSWTEISDLATGRNSGGDMSSGTTTVDGIVFGGTDPGGAATEEWTVDITNKTITIS